MNNALRATGYLLLCAGWVAPARGVSAPAVPVEGQPFAATLRSVDANWNLTFVSADGKAREMPAAELVRWGAWREPHDRPEAVFASGGFLVADEVLEIGAEQMTIDSDLLGEVKLPLKSLAGIIFRPPWDGREADRLVDRVFDATGDTDRLLSPNGDELVGSVVGATSRNVQFKAEEGSLALDRAKISAIIFNPALRSIAGSSGMRAWVGLRDGSRFLVTAIATSGDRVSLTLADGTTLTGPADAVVALQPLDGGKVYLSDLKPAAYRHIPFLNLDWPYRADHSVTGGSLRAAGRRYLKGLGLHSAARLTYDLDQPMRRFEAELAVDDETAGAGSIVGRVFTDDGSGRWQLRYESPVVRGGMAPLPVAVDISGAKRISLLVDFADRADQQDHADWLDARLVR